MNARAATASQVSFSRLSGTFLQQDRETRKVEIDLGALAATSVLAMAIYW